MITKGEVSSWINFLRNIKGKNLSRATIFRRFNREVEKEDYLKSEKEKLVNYAIKYGLTA